MLRPAIKSASGYTYFGILFVVALIGLSLSGASLLSRIQEQRLKEQQLLYIGNQYIKAIASYYHGAPGGFKKYPKSLNDLLLDKRYPTIKRHLRKPWLDPMTLSNDWGLVRTKQGGIAGIYSKSLNAPIKRKSFGSELLNNLLEDKTTYQQWRFIYIAALDESEYKEVKSFKSNQPNTDISASKNMLEESAETDDDNENSSTDSEGEMETGAEFIPVLEAGETVASKLTATNKAKASKLKSQ